MLMPDCLRGKAPTQHARMLISRHYILLRHFCRHMIAQAVFFDAFAITPFTPFAPAIIFDAAMRAMPRR